MTIGTHPIYDKLKALNITLPDVSAPAAAYLPFVQTGKLVFLSGHLLLEPGNHDQGLLILRFDLRHFNLRDNARLEAQLEDAQGTGIVIRCSTCDFELAI